MLLWLWRVALVRLSERLRLERLRRAEQRELRRVKELERERRKHLKPRVRDYPVDSPSKGGGVSPAAGGGGTAATPVADAKSHDGGYWGQFSGGEWGRNNGFLYADELSEADSLSVASTTETEGFLATPGLFLPGSGVMEMLGELPPLLLFFWPRL